MNFFPEMYLWTRNSSFEVIQTSTGIHHILPIIHHCEPSNTMGCWICFTQCWFNCKIFHAQLPWHRLLPLTVLVGNSTATVEQIPIDSYQHLKIFEGRMHFLPKTNNNKLYTIGNIIIIIIIIIIQLINTFAINNFLFRNLIIKNM